MPKGGELNLQSGELLCGLIFLLRTSSELSNLLCGSSSFGGDDLHSLVESPNLAAYVLTERGERVLQGASEPFALVLVEGLVRRTRASFAVTGGSGPALCVKRLAILAVSSSPTLLSAIANVDVVTRKWTPASLSKVYCSLVSSRKLSVRRKGVCIRVHRKAPGLQQPAGFFRTQVASPAGLPLAARQERERGSPM